MTNAPNPPSSGVTLTVNLSDEAYDTLKTIAALFNETETVALHRCIATTYDLQQRSAQSSESSTPGWMRRGK